MSNILKRVPRNRMLIAVIAIVVILVAVGGIGFTMFTGVLAPADYGYGAPMVMQESYNMPASGQNARVSGLVAEGEFASYDDAPADASTVEEDQGVSDVRRIILKDASLQITVADAAATIQEISSMAQEMGGWVVSANSNTNTAYNGETYSTGSITVRVPADRLDEAMERIRGGADTIHNETVNGRDVTAEYVDMDSRMNNLKASETALVEILSNARRIDDVLAVQTQLTQVRSEIEVLQGRLRYYDEAAAYSSIAVTVQEVVPTIGETQVDNTWNPLRTAASAVGSLVVIGQAVIDFIIVVVIVGVPFLLAAVVVIWLLRRLWRMIRPNRPTPPPAAPTAPVATSSDAS